MSTLNTDWQGGAICHLADPEIFFPEKGEAATSRIAKSICRSCPVLEECLDYALELHADWGVWGGLTAEQRRILRRDMNAWNGEGDSPRVKARRRSISPPQPRTRRIPRIPIQPEWYEVYQEYRALGITQMEIADKMGLSHNTLRQRLKRIRKKAV